VSVRDESVEDDAEELLNDVGEKRKSSDHDLELTLCSVGEDCPECFCMSWAMRFCGRGRLLISDSDGIIDAGGGLNFVPGKVSNSRSSLMVKAAYVRRNVLLFSALKSCYYIGPTHL